MENGVRDRLDLSEVSIKEWVVDDHNGQFRSPGGVGLELRHCAKWFGAYCGGGRTAPL